MDSGTLRFSPYHYTILVIWRFLTSEFSFQAVPLQFLNALLSYLGDSISYGTTSSCLTSPLACCPSPSFFKVVTPSQGTVRWKLRLEYFAYETLQDLRIANLFEIIVDYPERYLVFFFLPTYLTWHPFQILYLWWKFCWWNSSPAIEDLNQCLEYTRQHSKLVESFISSLKYRLLTAGASTNDILHQYVSTIKALRAIDPAGVFLEAVAEPIRDYLRGRKDTIKCIITMLTDRSGRNANGSPGDSLLEELMRDEETQENVGFDDDFHTDDKQAWINASRYPFCCILSLFCHLPMALDLSDLLCLQMGTRPSRGWSFKR